jgi:hypothetical protein
MDDAGHLKKYTGSSWSTISGYTYQTGYPTEFVEGQNTATGKAMYILNGKDPLSRTDGSTITTFTQVTDPVGGLTVAATGATGTSSYGYTYTLVTNYGETNPVTNVTISNGNANLSATNYNLLTITRSSDSNVVGYNVYGRGQSGNSVMYYMKFIPQTASGNPTYTDTGADTPNVSISTPVANTTTGKVASMGFAYHDTLILAGDPANPSRVWYSAGIDLFENFEIVNGGGFKEINYEDGDKVTAIVSFKDKIVIFKNRSSYIMDFTGTNGAATLSLVNPQVGCASSRSAKVVLNDVFFMSPYGSVFTLGYQQGYYGAGGVADLLRSNEVSIKIKPTIGTINPARISNAAAIYSAPNYSYILAYSDGSSTYNNKAAVYDTRYGGWVIWDNLNMNCLLTFIDSSNNELVLYGDDNTGRVVQLFKGSSDQGSAFTFRMQTKDFNANAFHLLKTWIWPTIHFRNVFGTIKLTLTTDGLNTAYTASVSSTSSYTGWSYDRWANFDWQTTSGSSASASASDAPRQVNSRFDARSLMFLFENTSTADSLSILGVQSRYLLRRGRRLSSTYILN